MENQEQDLYLRNANGPGIMMYEMDCRNCSEKEHREELARSLIRTTKNLVC